jgi:hypothetical protein
MSAQADDLMGGRNGIPQQRRDTMQKLLNALKKRQDLALGLIMGAAIGWIISTAPGWMRATAETQWWNIASAIGTLAAVCVALFLARSKDARRSGELGSIGEIVDAVVKPEVAELLETLERMAATIQLIEELSKGDVRASVGMTPAEQIDQERLSLRVLSGRLRLDACERVFDRLHRLPSGRGLYVAGLFPLVRSCANVCASLGQPNLNRLLAAMLKQDAKVFIGSAAVQACQVLDIDPQGQRVAALAGAMRLAQKQRRAPETPEDLSGATFTGDEGPHDSG